MPSLLFSYYDRLVLQHPGPALLGIALLLAFLGYHSTDFRLDASADSLALENDQALRYYRKVHQQYGSDDSLIVTYTPSGDLFSAATLADLRQLRDELGILDRIERILIGHLGDEQLQEVLLAERLGADPADHQRVHHTHGHPAQLSQDHRDGQGQGLAELET